jgi:hypothetical protein
MAPINSNPVSDLGDRSESTGMRQNRQSVRAGYLRYTLGKFRLVSRDETCARLTQIAVTRTFFCCSAGRRLRWRSAAPATEGFCRSHRGVASVDCVPHRLRRPGLETCGIGRVAFSLSVLRAVRISDGISFVGKELVRFGWNRSCGIRNGVHALCGETLRTNTRPGTTTKPTLKVPSRPLKRWGLRRR